MDYQSFLGTKRRAAPVSGIEPGALSSVLYPFQRAITAWAVKKGRAAIFADCGLGKTLMQLEWARRVGGPTLIVAPLAVTHQTVREAEKLGLHAEYCTAPRADLDIQVTNYQRLESFLNGVPWRSLVLDESSILKSLDGKTRTAILRDWVNVPYRLACTATPSPNDLTELGNHAEFLGVMSFKEMSATYFVKDSNSQRWRLKGHAQDAFFKWLATWSLYVLEPADVGYPDSRFSLPPLTIQDLPVHSDYTPAGRLFPGMEPGITGRILARKGTLEARIARAAELIESTPGQWLVWCGLNAEADGIAKAVQGAINVEGKTPDSSKVSLCNEWIAGTHRVMVSKPALFGFGMNLQNCHNVLFLGLGDSYEQYYQAIRRCWRYGQEHAVNVYVITSEAEMDVVRNIREKETQARRLAEGLVANMRDFETAEVAGGGEPVENIRTDEATGEGWKVMLGDSTERLKEIPTDTVGMSVFSPPFVSLYTYTATERDLGNCADAETFFEHFAYIIQEIYRTTIPGRLACVHVSQVPAMLSRDGFIGMKDFRAQTVVAFQEKGWIYHGEVVIDKDPQAQAIRTKSKGLLFVQLRKDASWLRPALADYILVFRKPGENPDPIHPDVSNDEWISWARPIWYGIQETRTLNYRVARTEKDERHICPLQLDVIERCVRLWSNKWDLVLSPFTGIGSEGYVSILNGRRFVGCELKPEYYQWAVKNLQEAESQAGAGTLFSNVEQGAAISEEP